MTVTPHPAPRMLVFMGVSGSGKSTIAAAVADALGWDFAEGDTMHSPQNIAKMRAGVPLTDDDRWPWLRTIRSWIDQHRADGTPGVVTCSALKRSYRDILAAPGVVFVYISGDASLIRDRLTHRTGHYMPPSLLDSQLATLEPPQPDEPSITVAANNSPDEQSDDVIAQLGLTPRT